VKTLRNGVRIEAGRLEIKFWWRFANWVACTITTNAAPPDNAIRTHQTEI